MAGKTGRYLYKSFVIDTAEGWIENNGEVIEAEQLAQDTVLSVRAVMTLAKKGKCGLRLISADEALGRHCKKWMG